MPPQPNETRGTTTLPAEHLLSPAAIAPPEYPLLPAAFVATRGADSCDSERNDEPKDIDLRNIEVLKDGLHRIDIRRSEHAEKMDFARMPADDAWQRANLGDFDHEWFAVPPTREREAPPDAGDFDDKDEWFSEGSPEDKKQRSGDAGSGRSSKKDGPTTKHHKRTRLVKARL